jgi:hypothetical protein
VATTTAATATPTPPSPQLHLRFTSSGSHLAQSMIVEQR